MNRRNMLAALASGAALASMSTVASAQAAPSLTLDEQVRRVAEAYGLAWNAADMDAMAALYADDVHWVNIVGMHWQGKAQVDRAHRAYFEAMFRGVPIELQEIESVTPLPGGGAIAVLRWSVAAYRSPNGTQMPPSRNRMSLTLVPQGGRLVIAHGANIEINEAAQTSNPIQD